MEMYIKEKCSHTDNSYEILRAIIESSSDYIYMKDRDWRYVAMNSATVGIIGKPISEIIGKTDFEIFPEHVALKIRDREEKVIAGGVSRIFEETYRHEGRTLHLSTAKNICRDEAGNITGIVGISRDITEQKQYELGEAFLAEAGTLFSSALQKDELLKLTTELAAKEFCDWLVIDLLVGESSLKRMAAKHRNPEMQLVIDELLKLELKHDARDDYFTVIHQKEGILVEDAMNSVFNGINQPKRFQLYQQLGIGSYVIVPMLARGVAVGTIFMVQGPENEPFNQKSLAIAKRFAELAGLAVENLRLRIEREEAIQSRDEFFSIASHELKTPLTGLSLQLQFLTRDAKTKTVSSIPTDNVLQFAERADKAIIALKNLINELMDVTKIRAQQLTLSMTLVNLSELLHEVIKSYQEQFQEVECTVQHNIEADVMVSLDRMRIEQILSNLMTNIIKYAPHAPVSIRLISEINKVRIEVQDKGPGISVENQGRIFNRFERANLGKEHISGLGLGLYIARKLVEAHNGKMSVVSQPGEGSCFIMEFPKLKSASLRLCS